MVMEKGKKPSNGEEDDFLRLLMTDYDLSMVPSSPLPPPLLSPVSGSSSETAPNPNPNSLPSNLDLDQNLKSKNVSSESLSKGDYSVINEMEEVDEEEFYSKFLSLSNPVLPATFDGSNPKLPTESLPKRVPDLTINAPETAVKPPAAAPSTRGRPRGKGLRKSIPPEKLAELSMQDPKKAKRIITNRMSAVRAKEKKKLYTFMLEHKIRTLQSETASLSAHLSLLQTESMGLNAENARLKEQTGFVMRQIRFQDSLNDEIRKEIQSLIMLTQNKNPGMMLNNGNNPVAAINTQQFQPWLPNPYQLQQLQQMNTMNAQFQRGPSAHPDHLLQQNPPSSSSNNHQETLTVEENPPSSAHQPHVHTNNNE